MAETLTKIELTDRAVLKVSGPDAVDFLQGLITNDITKVSPDRTIYAALLTPQGKFLFDFFILDAGADGEGRSFLFDCEKARAGELKKRLTMYKLRAKASIEDVSEAFAVFAFFNAAEPETASYGFSDEAAEAGETRGTGSGYVFIDPRLAAMGYRSLVRTDEAATDEEATGTLQDYLRHRLALGVPEGGIDIEPEKSFLLESNFEEMNGVDFKKGCYVGQELTARTKHRGSIRRRILKVSAEGTVPDQGTEIVAGTRQIGTILSGLDGQALAIIRTDRLEDARKEGAPVMAGDMALAVQTPDWLEL